MKKSSKNFHANICRLSRARSINDKYNYRIKDMKMNKKGGFEFLTDNLGTIVFVLIVLIAILFLVILLSGPSLSKLIKSFSFS